MNNGAYDFYKGRLKSAPSYGFREGHKIMCMVTRCAFWDSTLTVDEFNSIMILADKCHIKMMEDNYNAGWNE